MAPLMVKNFGDITDKRVLAYSAQILLDIMEVEFSEDQKTKMLEMHGFKSELINEVLKLGNIMTMRLKKFRLSI